MIIDLIDNRPIKQPSPVTNEMAEAFFSNSKFCVRFHANISKSQCLMNQATGQIDYQGPYGHCPSCPSRVLGTLPKALRTADRSTFRLPGSTVNTIDDPDTIHRRRRSRKTRP